MLNPRRRYEDHKPSVPAYEVITALVREVFGTYFIEIDNWSFPDESQVIGRTYFSDRKKQKHPIGTRTVDKLILIYELAFNGKSSYDPVRISENLVRVLDEQYNIDVSYAMFFDDDTIELRAAKIRTLRAMVREIACYARELELIDPTCLERGTYFIRCKLLTAIMRYCHGTYTETVINALDKRLRQSL